MKYWLTGDTITAAGLNQFLTEEYNNHHGILDNFITGAASGAGAITEKSGYYLHSIRLSTGTGAVGGAYFRSKNTWTLSSIPIIINFILDGNIDGSGNDRNAYIGLDNNIAALGNFDYNISFWQGTNNTWYTFTKGATTSTLVTISDIMSSSTDGKICTIIATDTKVYFLVDGVVNATHTTNIPTGIALQFGAQVYSSSAAVSITRTLDVDSIGFFRGMV